MTISFKEFIIAESLDEACWKNYTMVGMKKKDGREVPNCVPKKGVPKMRKEDASLGLMDDDDEPDIHHPDRKARGYAQAHKTAKKVYKNRLSGMLGKPNRTVADEKHVTALYQSMRDWKDAYHDRLKELKSMKAEEAEQMDEALPPIDIRYAVNHWNNKVRESAREFKKAIAAYNDAHAKLASQRRDPTREQEDELANHFQRAQHHHREFKKRLAQLAARKNEDLDEGFKEENKTQKPHPKGTRVVVSHKGHQKVGKVIRHDPGGPDSSPFYIVDVGEYGSHKVMAHHVRKEDINEGSAAWQRKEGKNPEGGLNRKGVESYRRENPGSKLQMAVTTKPSKLKPGSKAAKRRKSFCARMGGMPGPMKDEKGRPTRKALSLRKWNC